MKLIVGLGNPGTKYQNNRHNLGFMVVDDFLKQKAFSWEKSLDFICYFAKIDSVVLMKSTTFMNSCGQSVRQVANFYKVRRGDILVIHDDLDLDFGRIRLAFGGLSAGHRGIASIIENLAYVDFCRLRVGIGHPSRKVFDPEDFGVELSRIVQTRRAVDDKSSIQSRNNDHVDVEKYVLEDFTAQEKEKLGEIIKRCNESVQSYLDAGIEATMNRFN